MLAQPYALAHRFRGQHLYLRSRQHQYPRDHHRRQYPHDRLQRLGRQHCGGCRGQHLLFRFFTNTVRKFLSNGTQFVIAGIPGTQVSPATAVRAPAPNSISPMAWRWMLRGTFMWRTAETWYPPAVAPLASSISVVNAAGGNGVSITPGEIVTHFRHGAWPVHCRFPPRRVTVFSVLNWRVRQSRSTEPTAW